MQWKKFFRDELSGEFDRRRAKNPDYSLRKFAKDLHISPGGLSEVLNGNLSLSPERAADLVALLELDTSKREWLFTLMNRKIQRPTVSLPMNHAIVLTDWLYSAVLLFFDLDIEVTTELIAKKLRVDSVNVDAVIEDLLTRGFLIKDESGHISKCDVHWTSGDGPTSEVIRAFHRQNLKVAERAIEEVPTNLRDFSTITFVGNELQLEQARKEIRDFHGRLSSLMAGENLKTQVYRLSISLFPLDFDKGDS